MLYVEVQLYCETLERGDVPNDDAIADNLDGFVRVSV